MMTGEHFTNFFLDGLPQIAIGLDDEHLGPPEVWLQVPKKMVPSNAGLAAHITASLIEQGQQPALSYGMKIDHGFMTVYYWLDNSMELPMVPIVLNCTTPPLMTVRQFHEFGVAIGNAIRSYDGLERVGLVAGGGLSHFVGEPRVGDIDEEFDNWFLDILAKGDLSDIIDIPNDELMEAGNGTGEIRAWVALAGAMRGRTRPGALVRAGLRVDQRDGRRALRRRYGSGGGGEGLTSYPHRVAPNRSRAGVLEGRFGATRCGVWTTRHEAAAVVATLPCASRTPRAAAPGAAGRAVHRPSGRVDRPGRATPAWTGSRTSVPRGSHECPAGPVGSEFLRRCDGGGTDHAAGGILQPCDGRALAVASAALCMSRSNRSTSRSGARGAPSRGAGVVGPHLCRPDRCRSFDTGAEGIADPASIFLQVSATLTVPDATAVGDALILAPVFPEPWDERPWVSIEVLRERVGRFHGRGKRTAAAALELIRQGAESRTETLLRLSIVRAGLPEPDVNVTVTHQGRFVGRGDLVYRRFRLVIEYDGDHHRTDTRQFDKDLGRLDDFAAAGWRVVRVSARSLFGEPERTIERIERALRAAGWQPGDRVAPNRSRTPG